MNPGGKLDTSILGPMVIIFALNKRKIAHGFYKFGRLKGILCTDTLFSIILSLGMDTRPKYWWKIFNIVWVERPDIVGVTTYFLKLV